MIEQYIRYPGVFANNKVDFLQRLNSPVCYIP